MTNTALIHIYRFNYKTNYVFIFNKFNLIKIIIYFIKNYLKLYNNR